MQLVCSSPLSSSILILDVPFLQWRHLISPRLALLLQISRTRASIRHIMAQTYISSKAVLLRPRLQVCTISSNCIMVEKLTHYLYSSVISLLICRLEPVSGCIMPVYHSRGQSFRAHKFLAGSPCSHCSTAFFHDLRPCLIFGMVTPGIGSEFLESLDFNLGRVGVGDWSPADTTWRRCTNTNIRYMSIWCWQIPWWCSGDSDVAGDTAGNGLLCSIHQVCQLTKISFCCRF